MCVPLRASQRRQRAQFHHRASTPPVPHGAGIFVQAVVPGNGIRSRWPHTAFFALGGGSGWICVLSNDYWFGLEYAPNTNNAWNFNTNNGNQNANNKNNQFYAMAVRPGG